MSTSATAPPRDALARAKSRIGTSRYLDGAGGFDPRALVPDSAVGQRIGCDGPGFLAWCLGYPRHQPGFTWGWDWVNADSMIVEAETRGEWFRIIAQPEIGAVLAFPSVALARDGYRDRVGHAGLIVDAPTSWDPRNAAWASLRIVHCSISIQRRRGHAIGETHAVAWAERSSFRGAAHPHWRTRVLRFIHRKAS